MWQKTKDMLRAAHHRGRMTVGNQDRVMPGCVIVGAQKAGTTSLFAYLAQHPQMLEPSSKEVHYFDYNYHRGEDWYRAHFPKQGDLDTAAAAANGPVMTFEASPYYMYHPLAVDRMAADLPGVRAIAMLRHPISRTYSHFWHEKRKDQDATELARAIAEEPERLAGEAEKLIAGAPDYYSYAHQHYSYVDRSRYAPQVRNLHEKLGRENVLVMKSEAFFTDPEGQTNRAFEFLGLPPADGIDYAPQNVGSYGDRIDAETVALLTDMFAEDYAELRDLAGPEFDWFEE